ncbi:MAG: GAF domain-containing protein [Desulfuromonadales bacterium]|nr:GAF domain-containing protein [Desulfuromonadales bacterium]
MKEEEKNTVNRAEEFLQVFKKGAEFTQELLKENERLRYQIFQLEEGSKKQSGPLSADAELLRRRVEELEQEKKEILERVLRVEEENDDFAQRYVEVETQNNMLANLYIASFQLHSTLDHREVLQIITEIVINLIGAEEFSVLVLDEKARKLQAVAAEGLELTEIPAVPVGEGIIGQAAKSGESYFIDHMEGYVRDLSNPLVCIPLKIKDHVIGVLVIYQLLSQKDRFADLDYELFTLLAGHAATAIFSSKLYSESERKLSTIQGFIDLMTK